MYLNCFVFVDGCESWDCRWYAYLTALLYRSFMFTDNISHLKISLHWMIKHAAYFPAYRYFVYQIMAKCRAEGQTGVVCSNSTRRQDASLEDLIAIIPISSLLTVLWPKFDRTEILGWISLSSNIHVVHHNIRLTNLVYSGSSAKSQQTNPTHVCYCFTGGLYYNLIVTVVCSINITTVYNLTVWSSRYTNHCVPLQNGLAGLSIHYSASVIYSQNNLPMYYEAKYLQFVHFCLADRNLILRS